MLSITINLSQVVGVAVLAQMSLVVWAAIYSRDPDRREAAQRVLAIFRRHHIPTVQNPPQAPDRKEKRHTKRTR